MIAFLQERAVNEEERPAVRVRALTALQPALSEEEMFERMGLHSYTLTIRIKVLTFLSRLEVLGLVFKVTYPDSVSKFLNGTLPLNRRTNLKAPTRLHLFVPFCRVEGELSVVLRWLWTLLLTM